MRKIVHVILEVTYLLNGIFQNVQERYTIQEVVEHPLFTGILYLDNRFFQPFQKQATVMEERRVCLFFSDIYENTPFAKNQQIQNFLCLKYVRVFAENTLQNNEVFNEDF